jgi:hypothetical protein
MGGSGRHTTDSALRRFGWSVDANGGRHATAPTSTDARALDPAAGPITPSNLGHPIPLPPVFCPGGAGLGW